MTPGFKIDTREFKAALRERAQNMSRTLPDELNQRLINIVGRAYDMIKPMPGSEEGNRARIKLYMNEQLSQRVKLATSGKRKGKFIKRGKRMNQLARANLIIQARRRKLGIKGLYGAAMREAEGKFKQAAQIGVGSLKLPLLKIIRVLNPIVRFKSAFTRTGTVRLKSGFVARIPTWPLSGYGASVQPAEEGWNPKVTWRMYWGNVPGTPRKIRKMIEPYLQRAVDAEAAEMRRHTAAKLQKDWDKVNARRS